MLLVNTNTTLLHNVIISSYAGANTSPAVRWLYKKKIFTELKLNNLDEL